MDHHLCSRDSEGSSIEVVIPEKACMGGQSRLATRRTKMVQSDVALGKEVVPGVERKRRVGRSEPCDEVVLPSLDSTFSCISTM